jgi:hypothetical protein
MKKKIVSLMYLCSIFVFDDSPSEKFGMSRNRGRGSRTARGCIKLQVKNHLSGQLHYVSTE